ncbi:hypothetical protein BP5796_03795 [Coleophoma crateriformis]|uniref:Amino acid permease/ SLC12A domain-containing protein n=1 Tax=Coleophoma crateriformis TaxID=565419 RepID=A0A3D8SGL0_9HELO|nr:hypothetical protein BP5796_03795 [Coleophoma crateriformis]
MASSQSARDQRQMVYTVEYTSSPDRKQISYVSAVFLIFNAWTSTFIWVAGMLIAFAGMLTYIEFGTGMPRNGGEKNYLEYVYGKPRFLITAMYAAYVVLLGWAESNSVVFVEYILTTANVEVGRWNQRGVGLACTTSAFLIHGLALK